MKFIIKNLGALDQADIELNKLTIICGRNNTGKTYLTYALYGFLKRWRGLVDIDLPPRSINKLREDGSLDIDLREFIQDSGRYISSATEDYAEGLDNVLGGDLDRFASTKLSCSFAVPSTVLAQPYSMEYLSDSGSTIATFNKESDSHVLTVSLLSTKATSVRMHPHRLIEDAVKDIVWGSLFPRPFIISSERTGVMTFKSELNLSKNRLFNLAHELKPNDLQSTARLIRSIAQTGYAMPISDNVDFVNDLASTSKVESEFLKDNPDIIGKLRTLIGGSYKLSKSGILDFVPNSAGKRMRLSEASSSVKSMLMLDYYLSYVCRRGDLLIIDEPELNLHPSSQRDLARILSLIVNYGVMVLITTHSDYLIKEFSTLIMLKSDLPEIAEIRERFHYTDTETLDHRDVSSYVVRSGQSYLQEGSTRRAKGTILCPSEVSPEAGIDALAFDPTIEAMNEIQDLIYARLHN